MKFESKYAFHGDPKQDQLSFPAGAILVQTVDSRYAPRDGWMHGNFEGTSGWFPLSHVGPVLSASMPPATPLPEANVVFSTQPGGTLSASAPPVAQAIPIPDSTPEKSAGEVPRSPPVHKQLDEHQISQLVQQGFTRGLAIALNDSNKSFAKRIWIVDNSGSMQKTDGHRLIETTRKHQIKFVSCTRWEEITECVCYHIQLAALIQAPTTFRLLNDPGVTVGPQQFTIDTSQLQSPHTTHPQDAIQIIKKARPGGSTPLTSHIMAIHAEVEGMAPQLRARGQKVAVIVATDGLPTDAHGYGGKAIQDQFVGALRMLEGLPVWVVIRLCTDEEDVVNFYNELDNLLELSLEVLDDFCGEAEEVHHHNAWLNYALPLHRMREAGFYDRIFDMLDERRLTKSEVRAFVGLLTGDAYMDGVPDPSLDWDGFLRSVDHWLKHENDALKQWDPMKKKLQPWLHLRRLHRYYGEKNCVIL